MGRGKRAIKQTEKGAENQKQKPKTRKKAARIEGAREEWVEEVQEAVNQDNDHVPPPEEPQLVTALAYALSSISTSDEPTYEEAMNGPDAKSWKEAMQAEINTIKVKGTYEPAKLPPG
jgi:hypothetical protein